jgi:hypothetical protein
VRLLKDGVKCQPTVELVPMFVPLVMAQAVVVTIKEEGEEEVELEPTLVTTYIKSYSSKDMLLVATVIIMEDLDLCVSHQGVFVVTMVPICPVPAAVILGMLV